MGVIRDLPDSIRRQAVLDIDDNVTANYSSNSSTISRLSFVAGETISAKDLLAIGTDGKVYKASSLASDNKQVFAIAFNSGIIDSIIETYNDNEIIVFDNITFNIGKTVFLSSAGTPTTNYNYTVGNLYQRLGTSINSNSFVIKIEESKEMG